MKKVALLLTGSLFLAFTLHAQKKQPKFLVDWSLGPSFPIGRFSETSYKDDNEVAGFAKTGMAMQLSLGYYLNESVGVMLLSGYTAHPQNKKAYEDYFEGKISGLTITNMEAESWKTVKLVAGGFWTTSLAEEGKLALLTKLTAGVSKFAVPEIKWSGVYSGGTPGVSGEIKKNALPWSFCYQVSAALEYKLSPSFNVFLDISSFNTTAKEEYNFTSPTSPTISGKNKYKQATVNTLLGISMRF
jgi:hypothetical protein